jgi:putative ABC transport system permease protein
MPSIVQEFRYALRGFRKSPVLAGAALLSLALGIGANTAIFSLTDQVLLRSLPVREPGNLVLFSALGRKSGFVETNYDDQYAFSYPMYLRLPRSGSCTGRSARAVSDAAEHELRRSHRGGARRSR